MQVLVGEHNTILRQESTPVEKIDKNLKKFIVEMKETMKEHRGVGLAAPQVGMNKRLFLVTLDESRVVLMINPKLIEQSEESEIGEEGCLSIPGLWANVERSKRIKVKFTDEKGDIQKLSLRNFNARVVLHELDHLEGVLFVDKIIQNEEENLLNQIKD